MSKKACKNAIVATTKVRNLFEGAARYARHGASLRSAKQIFALDTTRAAFQLEVFCVVWYIPLYYTYVYSEHDSNKKTVGYKTPLRVPPSGPYSCLSPPALSSPTSSPP